MYGPNFPFPAETGGMGGVDSSVNRQRQRNDYSALPKSYTMPGHVIGRFQPFHKEHAKYVKWAYEQCEELIIGITNADPSHVREESADPDRHEPEKNPYSYYQRMYFIESYLVDDGMTNTHIAPFPINKQELWNHYAPESITHYVRVVEEWDEEKVSRLKKRGRDVVSTSGDRSVSGTQVREFMRSGEDWGDLVPESVEREIRSQGWVLDDGA